MYELTIGGRPVPKKRPRVTKNSTYTPKETRDFEEVLLTAWKKKYFGEEPGGRLKAEIKFYYKDKRTADIDNLIKSVLDGLGGGSVNDWRPINDRQIKKVEAEIITGVSEDKQRTEILVREVEND